MNENKEQENRIEKAMILRHNTILLADKSIEKEIEKH